jgi:hypothetical protein
MGIPVLIIGESGSGKSASMRNFKESELQIINVARKPLPFRSKHEMFNSDSYSDIDVKLKGTSKKSIVIDDCQYLMANEFMRRAKETGFQKFTDIAQNYWSLIQTVIVDLPDDVIVYFLGHIERDQLGHEKFKTIGKMLDEKITIEGLYTIVLKAYGKDGKYLFSTQTNGLDPAKSPMDMFTSFEISNDLNFVDSTIREFYSGVEPERCEICGKAIQATPTKTVMEIITGTKKSMGKQACIRCCAEWAKQEAVKRATPSISK